MGKLSKLLHLQGLKRTWTLFRVNKLLVGPKHFEKKRKLLISIGYNIGENTKIVAPIECYGNLTIGKNCWIGKNLKINGNGTVIIGDNCDIAPEVTFQTGSHLIGSAEHRAGEGISFTQTIGNGTWIGVRTTIINETHIGNGCIVAACACVTKDVPDNTLVGGVPAKPIRSLSV